MHFLSHIGQDRWVAEVFKYRRGGMFLDFGGSEGLLHSNTYYLEKFLGWTGMLVEPNPLPFQSACAVRSCICINAALWPESRQSLPFTNSHGLSSLMEFADMDSNSEMRKKISAGTIYIDTINPMELMTRFSLPHKIEYMSLDVEGAEFEFLSQIDLREFQIATMSIEHNHDADKKLKIRNLLSSNGYEFLEHFNDDFFGKSH